MKWLNYPKLEKVKVESKVETGKVLFRYYLKHRFEPELDECFAEMQIFNHKVGKITIIFFVSDNYKQKAFDDLVDADNAVNKEFKRYFDAHFKTGPHWLADTLYFDDIPLCELENKLTDNCSEQWIVKMNESGRERFFTTDENDEALLDGKSAFGSEEIKQIKSKLIGLLEPKNIYTEFNLPDFVIGSVKQIKWAESIRFKFLKKVREYGIRVGKNDWSDLSLDPRWWIENRFSIEDKIEFPMMIEQAIKQD